MAKKTEDYVLDGAAARVAEGTRLYVLSAEPANYAALAGLTLAQVDLDSGDFATANGDVSGRKVTVAAQNNIPITASGSATHVAVATVGATRLLITTICTSQGLTSGGTVSTPAFDAEWADPT